MLIKDLFLSSLSNINDSPSVGHLLSDRHCGEHLPVSAHFLLIIGKGILVSLSLSNG